MKISPALPGEHFWSVVARSIQWSGLSDDSAFTNKFGLSRFQIKPSKGCCQVITQLACYEEFGKLRSSGSAYPLWLLNFDNANETESELQSGYFKEARESQVNLDSNWRYCPHCSQYDSTNCGTSYWRVEHNLPFVTHCVRHRVPLTAVPNIKRVAGLKMPNRLASSNTVSLKVSDELLEWSRFVVTVYHLICEDVSSIKRLRGLVWERLTLIPNSFSEMKAYFHAQLLDLEKVVPENLLKICFQFYREDKRQKSNILYTTWKRDGIQIRHPVYMLVILYWLHCEGFDVTSGKYENSCFNGHSAN